MGRPPPARAAPTVSVALSSRATTVRKTGRRLRKAHGVAWEARSISDVLLEAIRSSSQEERGHQQPGRFRAGIHRGLSYRLFSDALVKDLAAAGIERDS